MKMRKAMMRNELKMKKRSAVGMQIPRNYRVDAMAGNLSN